MFKFKERRIVLLIQSKIKHILVPMDGSKPSFAALDHAIQIARVCQATVIGVHVVSFLPAEFMPSVVPYRIYQKKEAGKFMEKAKERAAKKGILFKYTITYGNPAEQVIGMAKSKKFDLIVVGARGKGRVKEMFLGSVSNEILHKSRIPVMIVK